MAEEAKSIENSDEDSLIFVGFELRLSDDRLSGQYHGILEAKVQGLWGRVCMAGWNEAAANVTCRSLGYLGGSVYLHIVKNSLPFVMSNVTCTGTEPSLDKCQSQSWGDQYNCKYGDNDAGALCYNSTGKNSTLTCLTLYIPRLFIIIVFSSSYWLFTIVELRGFMAVKESDSGTINIHTVT